jgi:hypothetical protein
LRRYIKENAERGIERCMKALEWKNQWD